MGNNSPQFIEVVPVIVSTQVFLDRFDHFLIAHALVIVVLHCTQQALQKQHYSTTQPVDHQPHKSV
jgi:hypothetical protein